MSGTIGFIFSAISCLYLICGFQKIEHVKKIFENAEVLAENLSNQLSCIFTPNNNQSIIFLGNSILYPISIYGSLKINEVFGEKAFAYSLEGFCHSPIFSISKKDIVIILSASQFNRNKKANSLDKQLKKNNIPSFLIHLDSNKITGRNNNRNNIKQFSRLGNTEILLFSSFLVQLFIYKLAKKKKLEDCNFVKKKNILKISSQLIY